MSMTPRRWRSVLFPLLAAALVASPSFAQTEHPHHADTPPPEPAWTWSWGANVFVGWNYQLRKFTDFDALESQNWLMGSGEHPLGPGHVRLHSMLSLEPFTIEALGSPEVFQTGETYKQVPLIDYQHPHDLFMDLGATWTKQSDAGRAFVEVDAVGAPALGPPAFMHRASAQENPTAPLSHHQFDATHITHGVVTGGIERSGVMVEGSWFRGKEPDENRKDIEMGKLDSYSGRLTYTRGAWSMQASAGHLKTPEFVEPFNDVTRLTASIAYTDANGRLATTIGWGQNREVHGKLDAYLAEMLWRPRHRQSWYLRAELATKDILGASGPHPRGFVHFHPLSRVGALTVGHVFDIVNSRAGLFGLGADVTGYYVPSNLRDSYGSPVSFHLFLRYRAGNHAGPTHH
jgi:hypothetical protein